MYKLYSFDIFDTLICRNVLVPTDNFYKIANILLNTPGYDNIEVDEFVSARVRAEIEVIENTNLPEATIEGIWRSLCNRFKWDFSFNLISIELNVEKESFGLIMSNYELLKKISVKKRVILISDTYFPQEFINEQLERFGISDLIQEVYLSSTHQLTKRSGQLFDKVLEMENLTPNDLLHIGDNKDSDYKVPKNKFISVKYIDSKKLIDSELAMLKLGCHDQLFLRNIVGFSRFNRNTRYREPTHIDEYIETFLGPFSLVYSLWVLNEAKKNNLTTLFFVSRDCQLICRVAQKLSHKYFNIDCKYLFVSRKSLMLPSMWGKDLDSSSLNWVKQDYESFSIVNILTKLDLDILKYRDYFKDIVDSNGEIIKSKHCLDLFWKIILSDEIKNDIESNINNKYNDIIDYFKSVGLLDKDNFGIVDLGWRLNCQKSIKEILISHKSKFDILGFYLMIYENRKSSFEIGKAFSVYPYLNSEVNGISNINNLFRYCDVLEHLIGIADHETVLGYFKDIDGSILPRFKVSNQTQSLQINSRIQEKVLHYIDAYLNSHSCDFNFFHTKSLLNSFIFPFVTNPSVNILKSLQYVKANSDQSGLDEGRLIAGLSVKDIFFLFVPAKLHNLLNYTKPKIYWREASEKITNTKILILDDLIFQLKLNLLEVKFLLRSSFFYLNYRIKK